MLTIDPDKLLAVFLHDLAKFWARQPRSPACERMALHYRKRAREVETKISRRDDRRFESAMEAWK